MCLTSTRTSWPRRVTTLAMTDAMSRMRRHVMLCGMCTARRKRRASGPHHNRATVSAQTDFHDHQPVPVMPPSKTVVADKDEGSAVPSPWLAMHQPTAPLSFGPDAAAASAASVPRRPARRTRSPLSATLATSSPQEYEATCSIRPTDTATAFCVLQRRTGKQESRVNRDWVCVRARAACVCVCACLACAYGWRCTHP